MDVIPAILCADFSNEWCYSDQNLGVLKRQILNQNVNIIVMPYIITKWYYTRSKIIHQMVVQTTVCSLIGKIVIS